MELFVCWRKKRKIVYTLFQRPPFLVSSFSRCFSVDHQPLRKGPPNLPRSHNCSFSNSSQSGGKNCYDKKMKNKVLAEDKWKFSQFLGKEGKKNHLFWYKINQTIRDNWYRSKTILYFGNRNSFRLLYENTNRVRQYCL